MSITLSETLPGSALSKGPFRAPRGTQISCKGWQQEAALRMLLNNLDPDVAEKPEDLVVYGGTGKAARNWESFHAIVRSLRELANDETLLIQSGKHCRNVVFAHVSAKLRADTARMHGRGTYAVVAVALIETNGKQNVRGF